MLSNSESYKHPALLQVLKIAYSQHVIYVIEEMHSLSLNHLKITEKKSVPVASIESFLAYITKQVSSS